MGQLVRGELELLARPEDHAPDRAGRSVRQRRPRRALLIDLHAHVLPGVDDGPPDVAEAIALCRAMVAAGVDTVVATSHVSDQHPNSVATLGAAREVLTAALQAEGIPLTVLPGAEIAAEQASVLDDAELEGMRLGGGRYLLLESPLSPIAGDLEPVIERLQERGHRVVLAHPERAPMFQRDPERVVRLAAGGVLTSITATALTGRFGRRARRCAFDLLERGVVHDVASDAHDLSSRLPGMADDLRLASGEVGGLAEARDWFTVEAPAAILAGEHPGAPPARFTPPPPSDQRKGGPLSRLLRRR